MRASRTDKSLITQWWFTVDRLLLAAVLMLMCLGLIVSMAASPAIATKHGLDPFHFIRLHAFWFLPGLAILFATAFMTVKQIRRTCLIVFLISIVLMVLGILFAGEVKGARRWVQILGWSLQPSEFAKPAFVTIVAWLFAEGMSRSDVPARTTAILLYGLFVGLLVLQPDIGQAVLITAVWGAIFFLAGASIIKMGLLSLTALGALVIFYFALPHVRDRVDRFWSGSGDTFQVDTARESFISGGWFGKGPGEGQLKRVLPDAHADFSFAVIGEEFGVIVCLLIVLMFAFIVLRGLAIAATATNRFVSFGVSGLVILVGLQAAINMAVNVGLLPAKGMTLPFLSYGGSSFLGLSLTMGIILGLTRRTVLHKSPDDSRTNLRHVPAAGSY